MQCTARVIRHFPGPCVKYLEEESCEPQQRGDPFGRGHTRPHGNTGCAQEVSVTVQVFLELSSPPGHWLLVQPIITVLSTPSATAPHTPMAQAPAPRCEMSWAALAALTSSPGTVRWTPELSPAETPPRLWVPWVPASPEPCSPCALYHLQMPGAHLCSLSAPKFRSVD